MIDPTVDDLIREARLGLEVEADLNTPAFRFVLNEMAVREEAAITALLDADPDVEPHKIRLYQAEAKRFRAMKEDIETVVNRGREAHKRLHAIEEERIEDA